MHALKLLALLSCTTQTEPFAQASYMETQADGVGGPKALAQPGDILLENELIRVAVTTAHNSLGPSLYGGSIIDADLARADPRYTAGQGNDRLAEIFPTVNLNVHKSDGLNEGGSWDQAVADQQVRILSDGSEGAAVVRVLAPSEPFLRLLAGLWGLVKAPDFAMQTDYIIEPGKPWVTMRTTASFTDPVLDAPADAELLSYDPSMELLELALETGLTFGDFYLQGGDVNVFAPDLGFWEDGAVYAARDSGQNTFTTPFELDFVAGTSDGVSYGLASLSGPMSVPLFTSSQTAGFGAGVAGDPEQGDDRFAEGAAYTYERVFVIGRGDVGSVLDGILAARGVPTGHVQGHVFGADAQPISGASVLVYAPGAQAPYSQWESDVGWDDTLPDGSFGGDLPVGDWELVVHDAARGTGPRVPISVELDRTVSVNPQIALSAQLTLEVVDETGRRVPAKVTLFRSDGQPVVRDPVLGDGFISGSPEAVVFLPYGEKSVELPAGDYVAYATRGMEYELGVAELSLAPGAPAFAELQVVRTVDTSGWVSADFHVHANPSHDSGVSLPDRVTTMASENVEFLISSDHDYIADYRPVIQAMGMEPWISSAPGLEVTTVEVGHYIGFPLTQDYLAGAGGAFDWTGDTPQQMLDGLRSLGDGQVEPATFVAHPRDGILGYFDQLGFSAYGGSVGEPRVEDGLLKITNPLAHSDNFTLDFDALELFNGKRLDLIRTPTQPELDAYAADGSTTAYEIMVRTLQEQEDLDQGLFRLGYGLNGQVDDWFTLLNLGFQLSAIGNSDTHGTTSTESGCPRNYVASPTDDPAYIDVVDIAESMRAGHIFPSYGPFIRFTSGDAGMGDTVTGSSHSLEMEVQSPSWFNVERVELYENGRLIQVFDMELPNADVLNLATSVEVSPEQDSWYVMIAMGSDPMDPLFSPVEYAPVNLQEVVTDALSGVEALSGLLTPAPPAPRTHAIYPYALSNPIYVDLDGDGWQAPGLAPFMENEPVEPGSEE